MTMKKVEDMTVEELMWFGRKQYLQEVIKKAINEGLNENDLYVDHWTLPKMQFLGDAWTELKGLVM